jgi:hypothetical protein
VCYLFAVASETDQPETVSRLYEYAMLIILTAMPMNYNCLFIYERSQQPKSKEMTRKRRKQNQLIQNEENIIIYVRTKL